MIKLRFPYNLFAWFKRLRPAHKHDPWYISGTQTEERSGQNKCVACGQWYIEATGQLAPEQMTAMEQILWEKLIRGELGA